MDTLLSQFKNMPKPSWDAVWLFFYNNPAIGALLWLIMLDIFSGLLAAYVGKELSSAASYRGMMGKALILAVVASGRVIEIVVPGVPWGQVLAIFFCVTEAISIAENAARAGAPIPKQWMDVLRKLREEKEPRPQVENRIEVHSPQATINEQPKKFKRPSDVVIDCRVPPAEVAEAVAEKVVEKLKPLEGESK